MAENHSLALAATSGSRLREADFTSSCTDVNPRPLSPHVPSNGLIGCFSDDEKLIWATAWEPYQELFQGVVRCLHADFRIGGLQPGETKEVRGKIYIVPNDMTRLLDRYARDFPEHSKGK